MFTHEQIWRGIDLMAAHAQTSPSGLARRAGLDSTTFNPSKRVSADGAKLRWPSTESLSKAMRAANLDFSSFAALVSGRAETKSMAAIDLAERSPAPVFKMSGEAASSTALAFPAFDSQQHQAIQISGDTMRPVYRDGDILILDRFAAPDPGDRVLVEMRDGEVMAFELRRLDVQSVKLKGLSGQMPNRDIGLGDVRCLLKIVWASQ